MPRERVIDSDKTCCTRRGCGVFYNFEMEEISPVYPDPGGNAPIGIGERGSEAEKDRGGGKSVEQVEGLNKGQFLLVFWVAKYNIRHWMSFLD